MEYEFLIIVLKLIQSIALFLFVIKLSKIMFSMLFKIGNEPKTKIVTEEKSMKPTLSEYMERSKELEKMGFNQVVEIYIYTPYQKLLWIEQFSINFEGSFVIVTDKHDRTYACSINNIKKVRSTDLKSDDQSEESFSSYKPNDEFWSPKEHDINEQEEDWSDF